MQTFAPRVRRSTFRPTNHTPARRVLLKLAFLLIIVAIITPTIIQKLPSNIKCYLTPTPNSAITLQDTKIINIQQGATLNNIASILSQNQIIPKDKEQQFTCFVIKNKYYPTFKAGTFVFKEGKYSFEEIARRLQTPNPPTVKVTIPEGLRYDEIAERLHKGTSNLISTQFSKEEFIKLVNSPHRFKDNFAFLQDPNIKTLEGFLYPATYTITHTMTTEQIIKMMLQAFENYNHVLIKNTPNPAGLSDYQVVILASIVEREATGDLEEKRMVADILLRRLKVPRPLEVDATLLYPKKDWTAPITSKDKQNANPYNTYRNLGLPPTPISNPGRDSVYAVLNPIPNQYWYYLHGKDGKIRYAKTYQEHINNIYKYLR